MTAASLGRKKLRRSIRGLALAPFLVVAAPPSSGQQPPGAVFRSEVHFVEVDAFVADGRGEAVRGLRREDFQVFEEGVRQEITAFAEVEVPVERAGATRSEGAPRDVATNQEGVRGRIYAIVLDELHTDARRAGVVRGLARQFIERHMAANDVAAVVFTGGRSDAAQGFTGSRPLLLEAVGRFEGRKTRSATLERLREIERQRDLLAAEPGRTPGRLARKSSPPGRASSGIPRTSSGPTTPGRRWRPSRPWPAASATSRGGGRPSFSSAKASTTTRST